MSEASSKCPLSNFSSYGDSPTIAWQSFLQELIGWIVRKGYICEVMTEEDFNSFFGHTDFLWCPRDKPIAPDADATSKEQRAYKEEVREYNKGSKEMAEMVDQLLILFPDHIKNLFRDPGMRAIGTANCTLKSIYYKGREAFGELNASDIKSILAILATPYDGVESIRVLIARHKAQHSALSDADQPLSEFDKSRLLIESLNGRYEKAIDNFVSKYPKPAKQKFNKLEKILVDAEANKRSPSVSNELFGGAHNATMVPQQQVALLQQLEDTLLPKLLAAVATTIKAEGQNIGKAPATTPSHYCLTHGHNFSHDSASCNRQQNGHQVKASAANTMGGSKNVQTRFRKKT